MAGIWRRGKGNRKRACVYASIPRVSRNEDMQMQSSTHTGEHDRSLAVKGRTFYFVPTLTHTGHPFMARSRFGECFRQVEAEVVSNSREQFHQTWSEP